MLTMLSKPTCSQNHMGCDRVCVHQQCSVSAFICRSSQACEQIHKHLGATTLTVASWNQVEQYNQNIFKRIEQYISATVHDVTEKVEAIVGEMRQTLSRYLEKLNQIRASLRLRPQIADVRNKLSCGSYNKITGKEMASFYALLKDYNQFQNKQSVLVAVAHLNQKGYKLIQSVRKRITEFLHQQHNGEPADKSSIQDKITRVTQKISKEPNNPQRYFQRGLQFSKLGKIREAEEDYNMAIALNPNYIDARLNRGIIFYNTNRFNQAQVDYTQAITLDPSNAKAYNNRGRLYHDCRKLTQAEEDYKKALSLSPVFIKCYLNRAMLYNQTHRLKQAENDYSKVIQLEDSNAKAFSNRGLLRFHLGKIEEAQTDYNRAIELDPTNDGTLNNRGYLYFTQGQYAKALSDYNRALQIKQKPLYFKNRSDVYNKLGKTADAQEDLKRAKEAKHRSAIA